MAVMKDIGAIKLAIWDLDGTIIDSFGVFAAILKEAAELSGRTLPDEQTMRHNFHGSLDASIKSVLDMVDGDDLVVILNDFLRVQVDYYKHPEEHLFPDALALAKRLHSQGARQIVVTNREHKGRGNASPRYLIENSSMKQFIELVIPGEVTAVHKPDPGVMAGVQGIDQLDGSDILVIGDQFVDAKLADNLGAHAIIVNRNPEPVPHLSELGEKPDFMTLVSSLDEVR